MRILSLHIAKWRNFRNVEICVPEDSTLVCLIGENGTGKSNILELISAAANQLGISPGIENLRGNPFTEEHEVRLEVHLDTPLFERLPQDYIANAKQIGLQWNGIVSLSSKRTADGQHRETKIAGGQGNETQRTQLAKMLCDLLRQEKETNYLSLDADRSYPPMQIPAHLYAEALGRDWETTQWQKNRAFVSTRTMYDEWLQYFLAMESQYATKHVREERRAAELHSARPEFVDAFKPYKEALQGVLPHLKFVGVDSQQKTLVFDSAGLELRFNNLSGGEREIAFIVGQIDRFKLRRGFLLIDEPELHLNPDLLRNWVAYLRDTIETGQVWIGTHSLEAVETAGPNATFVLERTQDTRLVEKAATLSKRPVLAVLSAAVGSPAFSLRNLRFVYVEGDRQGRERDRFFRLYGDSRFVRFIEGGGCEEIAKKVKAVRELAEHADEQLCIGGILDRDFRTDELLARQSKDSPLFVLPVHEVENYFLHPSALSVIANRSGVGTPVTQILVNCADRFAGLWIANRAMIRLPVAGDLHRALRQAASELTWSVIDGNRSAVLDKILAVAGTEPQDTARLLQESAEAYADLRASDNLWAHCMGKEVLGILPRELGLQSVEALEQNVLACWKDGHAQRPEELTCISKYIDALRPVGR
jgi:predicted ATPase